MSTTQLFAELLVIGIGAALWLSFLVAAAAGYPFVGGLPRFDTWLLILLGGVAYVLGIVVDRVAHWFFQPIEKVQQKTILDAAGLPSPVTIERFILVSSEVLGRQIQYNRSRLRICRAWLLNSALATLAFALWNFRVAFFDPLACLVIVGIGVVACGLIGWAAWALSQDHYQNLRESYEFLREEKNAEGQGS